MLPLKLVIKGLYSYQEEQSIDFTKLTEAKLFGIFGAVGSGKSSILEAVSFALYGETERLNRNDRRSYNMMNLKCGDLFLDFTFKAGNPEHIYRSMVSCKRNKKTFEDVSSIDRKGYQLVNDEWLPIEITEIPKIIGLSYENFRRTIIIPQGKFSEFLQLGDKDRTSMLKEIFNLQRFEYYYQVASLEKKNSERISNVKGKLEQLGEVSQGELQGLIDERSALKSNLERLALELEEKVELERRLNHLRDLFLKLETQKRVLNSLEQQRSAFNIIEKDIKHYEQCLIQFKPLLDLKVEDEKKIKIAERDLKAIGAEVEKLKSEISDKEIKFVAVDRRFQEKESLKEKAEELEKVKSIINLEKEITLLQERVSKGNALILGLEENRSSLEKQREQLQLSIAGKRASLPDIGVLKEIIGWFGIKKNIVSNIDSIHQEVRQLEDVLLKSIDGSTRMLPLKLFEFFSNDERSLSPNLFLNLLQSKKQELGAQQENLAKEIEHLSIQSTLEGFVSSLKNDHPCPLCGSTHHPDKLNIIDVSTQLQGLRLQKNELVEFNKVYEEMILSEQGKVFKIENLRNQLEKERNKLAAEENKLNQHLTAFVWKDFDHQNSTQAENLFQEGQKILKEIEALENRYQECVNNLDKSHREKEKYTAALQQLNLGLGNKTSEINIYRSQLRAINLSDYLLLPEAKIEKQIKDLKNDYHQLIKEHENLSTSINSLKQGIARMEGQMKETVRYLSELQEGYTNHLSILNNALASSDFASIDDVEYILSKKIDLEREKEKMEVYKNQLSHAQKQLQELEEETLNQEYNSDQHEEILKNIKSQKEQISTLTKELGKLDISISTLQENLILRDKLLKELAELDLRKEDLNVLKQLFKGSGFVNYVSSVFLKNLCNAANDRFYKLTRQKLRLELTENNNFQVRDFLNNGKLRSVKTLSGGQTFQASLSLALALAESIQQQNKAEQNFFFLDEGFGSQDKESLNTVFETLKSLRKENRIVGIISHVNELQEEIDVYLDVVNDEEKGSMVKGSWER